MDGAKGPRGAHRRTRARNRQAENTHCRIVRLRACGALPGEHQNACLNPSYGIDLRTRPRPPPRRPGSERAASRHPIRHRAGRLCESGALSRVGLHLALLLLRSPARALQVLRVQAISPRTSSAGCRCRRPHSRQWRRYPRKPNRLLRRPRSSSRSPWSRRFPRKLNRLLGRPRSSSRSRRNCPAQCDGHCGFCR